MSMERRNKVYRKIKKHHKTNLTTTTKNEPISFFYFIKIMEYYKLLNIIMSMKRIKLYIENLKMNLTQYDKNRTN